MSKVKTLHKKWMKDPEYRAAYEELGEEFEIAAAIIEARSRAGLTQEELAERMDTPQSTVARLEGGAQNTTIKTLRKVAAATGTQLKITYQ